MNKVYFTNIRSIIIDLLDGAEKSINIAVAWFTNEAIFQVILNKAAANKDIRIIISDSYTNIYDNWNQRKLEFEKITKKGGIIYVVQTSDGTFFHHKYATIDKKIALTGSHNWSSSADVNFENLLITDDNEVVRHYDKMFDYYVENFSIPFETFMLTSNFAGLSDLQIKDSEIFNLARKFERRVQENISAAQTLDLNINFDRLQNKIKQFTAVGAAKKLSNAEPQTGFEELAAIRKLELSFESLVVEEEFAALFDRNTKQHAMEKLKKYEYSFNKKDN